LRVVAATGCFPSTPAAVPPFGATIGVFPQHFPLLQWTEQPPPFPSQSYFTQPYPPPPKPKDAPPAALHDDARLSFETVLIGNDFVHPSLANKAIGAIVSIAISPLRIETS
jgi:hypothetical protein